MKVLVTGCCGMLGSDLVDALKEEGYQVEGVDIEEMDITDREKTRQVLSSLKPEMVVHTAALTDVDGCEERAEEAFRVNGEGTGNVASSCRDCDARMIYISTDFVFDGEKENPYVESDRPEPLNVYGRSKLSGENRTREILGENLSIVRTSWLFGRRGKNFVETILKLAREKERLRVVSDQVGCPTYTIDLAMALSRLLKDNPSGTYHISNKGSCSWYEFAGAILEYAGIEKEVVPVASEELSRPARRPRNSILGTERLPEEVSSLMRDWRKALKDYLEKGGIYRG